MSKKTRAWFLLSLIIILFWLVPNYGVTLVRVSGNSMNTTLHDGQLLILMRYHHLLVQLGITEYERGDIVVLKPPKELQTRASRFIKRLVALPNDRISIRNNKVVLNDRVLNEPYILEAATRAENFPEVLVFKGEVVAFEGFALAELPEYLRATLEMLESLPQDVMEQSKNKTVSYIGTIELNEGLYFVLGDSRSYGASEDSRLFGTISQHALLGKVLH